LSDMVDGIKGGCLIGGDFNARIYFCREVDKDAIGPHIIEKSRDVLDTLNEGTRENRNLFIGFAKSHSMMAVNTMFQKPPEKLITYIEKTSNNEDEQSTRHRGPPYDASKYAQVDYWLAPKESTNIVQDVQSRKDIYFDSDHFLLEIIFSAKVKARSCKNKNKAKRYYKPDDKRWHEYNNEVRTLLEQDGISLASFTNAVTTAAGNQLLEVSPEVKKHFISKQTWDKIETRNKMNKEGCTKKEMKDITREIGKAAKVDKQNHLIEQFNENPRDTNKKGLWKSVKQLKKKFVPNFIKMKNKSGQHVPLVKRAEAIA